ncbi:MAG: hypothetical protein RR518_07625 [Coprobacillus sp.]
MVDNSYFYKYINLLDKLTNKQINEIDLLDLFCEYISSNPEFKYNGTYLRDSLIVFQEKLTCFLKKRDLIISFSNVLSCNYNSLGEWYIIIDNLYIIKPDFQMELLLDFEGYQSAYFNNLINQFNLFEFNTDYVSVRYVKLIMNKAEKDFEIDYEYLETKKIKSNGKYEPIELYCMVEKTLKNNRKVGKNNAK